MSYLYIISPITNKNVSIYSSPGKIILKKYLYSLLGGAAAFEEEEEEEEEKDWEIPETHEILQVQLIDYQVQLINYFNENKFRRVNPSYELWVNYMINAENPDAEIDDKYKKNNHPYFITWKTHMEAARREEADNRHEAERRNQQGHRAATAASTSAAGDEVFI